MCSRIRNLSKLESLISHKCALLAPVKGLNVQISFSRRSAAWSMSRKMSTPRFQQLQRKRCNPAFVESFLLWFIKAKPPQDKSLVSFYAKKVTKCYTVNSKSFRFSAPLHCIKPIFVFFFITWKTWWNKFGDSTLTRYSSGLGTPSARIKNHQTFICLNSSQW